MREREGKGNPGMTDARAAAAAVGGVVPVPEFGGGRSDKDTDFNDMARVAGRDAVLACIRKSEKATADLGEKIDPAQISGAIRHGLDADIPVENGGARERRKKQHALPSEDALALAFASSHGDELRYVSFWGKWLKWTAERWQVEKTLAAFDLARKICHGHSLGGLRARTVAAIELMARSDRRLAATTDQWDSDPWLFNTSAGTVELKTGLLREHRPQDYITKIAGCSPDRDGCQMFFEFLNKIFDGDQDLIDYLQKFFGYILTGLTTEHAMLFFHGAGANGKSVLVSTIAGILGEYHRVASSRPSLTYTDQTLEALLPAITRCLNSASGPLRKFGSEFSMTGVDP
jgi:phage/plasmid-associated DNA primase